MKNNALVDNLSFETKKFFDKVLFYNKNCRNSSESEKDTAQHELKTIQTSLILR